ncbi:hypothetical protein ACGFIE_22125 [Micromonospora sp. NPDC049275]|uniref:C40 family peptidase n=1 Tax=Micromonospora sp. NPDC049275 TaxID=3364268 RepID=UPI003713A9CB
MFTTGLRQRAGRLVAGALALAATATALTAIQVVASAAPAQAASSIGGQITRAEVLQRATNWYNRRYDSDLTYSQSLKTWDGTGSRQYRRDCSGFVDMAWHLGADPNTDGLLDYTVPIARSALRPGDLLDDTTNSESPRYPYHAILFGGWEDSAQTKFWYYSFGSTPIDRVDHASFSNSTLSGHPTSEYQARRYNKIIDTPAPTGHSTGDYDGDGSTDLALYRQDPVNGSAWWVQGSRSLNIVLSDHHYGGSKDIPAPGDYNGDGVEDLALYRRDCVNGSAWWILNGRDRATQIKADFKYGGCADIPAPGDYNGDGVTDLALYRQDCTNGSSWSIYDVKNSSAIKSGFKYGGCKDIPAPGDYNGDKWTDLALYRQDCTNGSSWSIYNVRLSGAIQSGLKYGGCADIPAPGDYNGNGSTDLALYRRDCTNGSSWSIFDIVTAKAVRSGLKYGGCADIPAPGDYNGDGVNDLALYRRDCTNGSTWWVLDITDTSQIFADHHWGGCADIPATA